MLRNKYVTISTIEMIRKLKPEDRETLDELMIKLQMHFAEVDTLGESLPFKNLEDGHSYMQRMINDSDSMDGVVYVAEEMDKIVGFVQGVIVDHQPGGDIIFDTTHAPRKDGWIGLLFVEPEQRGKGIGRLLMDEIKKHFESEGCHTLRLLVLSDNTHTIEIYKKYGFVKHETEMVKKLET